MRCLLATFAGALVLLSSPLAFAGGDAGLAQPAPKVLPGSFQTLCVNGPRAGRYYCPVCDSGLYPGVLIFFPKVEEPNKPLPNLLKQIDDVLARYPDARMNACAICLDDGGYRHAVATDGEAPELLTLDAAVARKEAIESRLKELTQALALKNVTFALGMDPAGLKKYQVSPEDYATIIVYARQQIIRKFVYPEAKVDDSQAEAVLKLIDTTAAAAHKQAQPKHRQRR